MVLLDKYGRYVKWNRRGKARRGKWSDFDFERRILTPNDTEKKGKKRQFKLSERLASMIQAMPKKTLTV